MPVKNVARTRVGGHLVSMPGVGVVDISVSCKLAHATVVHDIEASTLTMPSRNAENCQDRAAAINRRRSCVEEPLEACSIYHRSFCRVGHTLALTFTRSRARRRLHEHTRT